VGDRVEVVAARPGRLRRTSRAAAVGGGELAGLGLAHGVHSTSRAGILSGPFFKAACALRVGRVNSRSPGASDGAKADRTDLKAPRGRRSCAPSRRERPASQERTARFRRLNSGG
jgi:hypothetical protein